MKLGRIIALLITLFLLPLKGLSQNLSDYLILQDIVPYKLETPQKVVGGYIGGPRVFDGAGVIASTGHFYPDHLDKTYEVYYEGGSNLPSATVQISQHAGVDSDKWLQHEMEESFRDSDNLEASPDEDTMLRSINNNRIFFYGGGVVGYRWISNNIVVNIQYTNLSGPKIEPLVVVQAYLQKFPSSIPASLVLDKAHDVQWIKDEMDRRLWLSDKWFGQLSAGKTDQKTALNAVVKSVNVFLDYREKYFGIKAADEKNLIGGYLNANDLANIQTKLAEYKTWWTANKTGSITLP